jgi:hypothetical protein
MGQAKAVTSANIYPLKTTEEKFFRQYVEILNPFFHL